MNPQDPLSELRDIYLPDPISWWPPAPGWWVLMVLVVATLFFGTRWLLRWHAQNCYRKEALRHLDQLKLQQAHQPLSQCRGILALLRRTAKTAYPQLSLEAELTPSMLSQLNQCCASPIFDENIQQQLGSLPYQKSPEIPDHLVRQLEQSARQWLKKHRRKAPLC